MWTAANLPSQFDEFEAPVREEAAALASSVYDDLVDDGMEPSQAAEQALAAALEHARGMVGAVSRPSVDTDSRPPVGLSDVCHAAVVLRAVADEAKLVEYRGARYVRGPYQEIVHAGQTVQRSDRTESGQREIDLTLAHLRQAADNARTGRYSLIPVKYRHGDDGPVAGVIDHRTVRLVGRRLYGRVLYTAAAAAQVRAGERPGVSVEMDLRRHHKATGEDVGAVLVGLAFEPHPQQHTIVVRAQFGAQADGNSNDDNEEVPDMAQQKTEAPAIGAAVREALSLSDTATEQDVVVAVRRRDEELVALRDKTAAAEKAAREADDAAKAKAGEVVQLGERLSGLEAQLRSSRAAQMVDALNVVPAEREQGLMFAEALISTPNDAVVKAAWDRYARTAEKADVYLGAARGRSDAGATGVPEDPRAAEVAFVALRDVQPGETVQEKHVAAMATERGRALWSRFTGPRNITH